MTTDQLPANELRVVWANAGISPLDECGAPDRGVPSPQPPAIGRSTAISGRPEMPCAVPDVADDAEVPQ